jgi:hypothetical protein
MEAALLDVHAKIKLIKIFAMFAIQKLKLMAMDNVNVNSTMISILIQLRMMLA